MSLTPEQIEYQESHAAETAVPRLIAVFIICYVISYISVVLRFISRRLSRTELGTDDWLMLASAVSRISIGSVVNLTLISQFTALHYSIPFTQCISDSDRPREACDFDHRSEKLCLGTQSHEAFPRTLLTTQRATHCLKCSTLSQSSSSSYQPSIFGTVCFPGDIFGLLFTSLEES